MGKQAAAGSKKEEKKIEIEVSADESTEGTAELPRAGKYVFKTGEPVSAGMPGLQPVIPRLRRLYIVRHNRPEKQAFPCDDTFRCALTH